MIVTKEWIEANRSTGGGYRKSQVFAVGESWPPKRGWIERVVGTEIDSVQQRQFEMGDIDERVDHGNEDRNALMHSWGRR